jgi:hypothetical protein
MEQGFGSCGSGVTGQGVIRPGASGAPHPDGSYEATSPGPVAGFEKVDDVAGQIGADGVGHGHFADKASGDGGCPPGPWQQT